MFLVFQLSFFFSSFFFCFVQKINLYFKGTPDLHQGGNYKYKILFKYGYVHFNFIAIIDPVIKSTLKDAFFVLQSYIINK